MARISEEDIGKREDFVKTFVECAQKPSVFSDVFLNHNLFEYNKKYKYFWIKFIYFILFPMMYKLQLHDSGKRLVSLPPPSFSIKHKKSVDLINPMDLAMEQY